jgi:hypothetical protein
MLSVLYKHAELNGLTHGSNIRPADGDNAGAAKGGAGDGRLAVLVRQERLEVRLDANGADARTAAAVRDTKGLVKVEMAHVGSESSR